MQIEWESQDPNSEVIIDQHRLKDKLIPSIE